MKEVKEDVSVAAPTCDEPRPLRAAKTQGDSPSVSCSPPQDNHFIPLAEAYSTAEKIPQFTMIQILQYFIWRTAVNGFPNAGSKSINESAMNLSRCSHIHQIMVCTSDEGIKFTGICCAVLQERAFLPHVNTLELSASP